jgi:Ankyrin repeats (many copies)
MQNSAQHVTFNPDCVLLARGSEERIGNPGQMECQVMEFFKAVSAGDLRVVQDLLFNKNVNVDVCDADGLTPLMAATVRISFHVSSYDFWFACFFQN